MSKMSQKVSDDVEKGQNNQPEQTGKVELVIQPGLLMNGSSSFSTLTNLTVVENEQGQLVDFLFLFFYLPNLPILRIAPIIYTHLTAVI